MRLPRLTIRASASTGPGPAGRRKFTVMVLVTLLSRPPCIESSAAHIATSASPISAGPETVLPGRSRTGSAGRRSVAVPSAAASTSIRQAAASGTPAWMIRSISAMSIPGV